MQQFAGEPLDPGPFGNDRRVLVSGRDDDLTGVDIAGGGLQPPAAGPSSMRFTAVPSRSSIPAWWACPSRWATTSSRVGNIGVPFG